MQYVDRRFFRFVLLCGMILSSPVQGAALSERPSETSVLQLMKALVGLSYTPDYSPDIPLKSGRYARQGSTIAALNASRTAIYVVDASSEEYTPVVEDDRKLGRLAISTTGRYLAYTVFSGKTSEADAVLIHDREAGTSTEYLDLEDHGGVHLITFSPDERFVCIQTHGVRNRLPIILALISIPDRTVRLIDPSSSNTFSITKHTWRDNNVITVTARNIASKEEFFAEIDIRQENPSLNRSDIYKPLNEYVAKYHSISLPSGSGHEVVWDSSRSRLAFTMGTVNADMQRTESGIFLYDSEKGQVSFLGEILCSDLFWRSEKSLAFIGIAPHSRCQSYTIELESAD